MIGRAVPTFALAVACALALASGDAIAQSAQQPTPPAAPQKPVDPHAGHQMPATPAPAEQEKPPLPPFIPPITDADRAAAFPDVEGHSVHDNMTNYFVLFDQLEWESGDDEAGLGWDAKGWVGRDRDRLWFRTEGQRANGQVTDAQTHVFYGRAISRWWDVVGGIRQDFRPGPAQTWAAVGVQGLAPYWFDVEATAYLGADWRSHFRFEAEYELLLTNRLILQPMAEMEIYGKDDPEHYRAAGLATIDTGVRLRVVVRQQFAPYVGVVWHQKYFGTADMAEAIGDGSRGPHLALGLRVWF